MVGDAQSKAGQTRARQIADAATGRNGHDQCQWAGPERLRQLARLGIENPFAFGGSQIRHMGDQRVEMRAPLGLVNFRHRRAGRRICTQPIDRLGREGDEPARAQNIRRRFYGGGIGRAQLRCGIHLSWSGFLFTSKP